MAEEQLERSVLIVGAGPAGLAAALSLATYGIDHMLVERHARTAHTPRAHIVNQRTVEILRHLRVSDEFHTVATPQHMMSNNLWVTSLAGLEVARSETWGTGPDWADEYRTSSPEPMANCPQTTLEPLLLDQARQRGSDIRFNQEFVSLEVRPDHVISTIQDRETGETMTVRSRYVIGADGARSRVLESAGLAVDGPGELGNAGSIWFRSDLSRFLAHRPGVLVWNVAPGPLPPLRLGTLICHKPFTEFVLSFLYDPAQLSLADLSVEEQVRMVRAAVGADVDVELLDLAGWQVKAQIASQYSSGRIFCMGDAVHRHPPTNGLGLNMSIADAFNLSWKLALVIQGRADESLLATYSTERQPVGAQGVQRAITSLQEGAAVDAALGLEPGQSEDDGWKSLERLWESGPAGDETRTKLQEAIDLSNYQFNAHGVELGYMYSSDAIAGDDIALPAAVGDPQLHYTPTTKPGARVPHARLERGHDSLSTLDVVPDLGFALITGVGGEGWAAAAVAIEKETGIEISVVVIGTQDGIRDSYGDWAQRREVGTTGCVLVRPDRHIAWRSMRYGPDSPDELAAAVARALGRPPAFVAQQPS